MRWTGALHPSLEFRYSDESRSRPKSRQVTRSMSWNHEDFVLRLWYCLRKDEASIFEWSLASGDASQHYGPTFPHELFSEAMADTLSPDGLEATLLAHEQVEIIKASVEELCQADAKWFEVPDELAWPDSTTSSPSQALLHHFSFWSAQ